MQICIAQYLIYAAKEQNSNQIHCIIVKIVTNDKTLFI